MTQTDHYYPHIPVRHLLEAMNACNRHAHHCQQQGCHAAAAAYRHAAKMLRRIQAGQAPTSLQDTLCATLEIFTGYGGTQIKHNSSEKTS